MNSPIILFMHVPKTAGTTLIAALTSVLGVDACRIQHEPLNADFLGNFVDDVKRGMRLFSGHLPLSRFIEIKEENPQLPIRIITTIRDPIAHFFSLIVHENTIGLYTGPSRRLDGYVDIVRNFDAEKNSFDKNVANIFTQYMSNRIGLPINESDRYEAIGALAALDFVIDANQMGHSVAEFVAELLGVPARIVPKLNSTSGLSYNVQVSCLDQIDTVATAIKHDIILYQEIYRKIILNSEAVAEVRLSERLRRSTLSAFVNGQPSDLVEAAVAFNGDDLRLHPPVEGRSELWSENLLNISRNSMFRSTVCVVDSRSHPVRFTVRLQTQQGEVSSSCVVKGGEEADLIISLHNLSGTVSIMLSTEMAGVTDCDYATSWFLGPRLTRS